MFKDTKVQMTICDWCQYGGRVSLREAGVWATSAGGHLHGGCGRPQGKGCMEGMFCIL